MKHLTVEQLLEAQRKYNGKNDCRYSNIHIHDDGSGIMVKSMTNDERLLLFNNINDLFSQLSDYPEVGRTVKLINMVKGCLGANDEIGVVMDNNTKNDNGLHDKGCGFCVRINRRGNGSSIWKVDGDWEYVSEKTYEIDGVEYSESTLRSIIKNAH